MTKSKIFLYFCLVFISGVLASSFFYINTYFLSILSVIGLGLIAIWWRKWRVVVLGFCLLFFVLGIFRYQLFIAKADNHFSNHIANYNGESVHLKGIVSAYPDVKIDSAQLILETNEINLKEGEGRLLLFVEKYPQRQYGDELEVVCKIQEPEDFDDFSYKNYLAKSEIYSVCFNPKSVTLLNRDRGSRFYAVIYFLKEKLESVVDSIFPNPQAILAKALLIGNQKSFREDLRNSFSKAGVSHIIAISGYHITVISGFVSLILLSLNFTRKKSLFLSILFIIFFVFLTGASASVVRAAIMGIITLGALSSNRISNAKNIIIFAGVSMLVFNPMLLRFDAGFSLSFGATLGIVYFYPLLAGISQNIPEILGIKNILCMTLAAQIVVLPIAIYSFDSFSVIAPLSNILILPFIPLTMFLVFLAILANFISIFLGKIIGFGAWVLLSYEIKMVEILAKIPFAAVTVKKINWLWIILYYIVLICVYYKTKDLRYEK